MHSFFSVGGREVGRYRKKSGGKKKTALLEKPSLGLHSMGEPEPGFIYPSQGLACIEQGQRCLQTE